MRLIDADTVDKLLVTLAEELRDSHKQAEINGLYKASCVVEIAPTIDHVKHGRWIPLSDQTAKCSLCGMYETTHGKDETGRALIHKATKHYCPYCGARMDL